MQKKLSLKAFTLIEILIAIVIIGIALIGISRFNFGRLTNNQFVEIETEKVKNIVSEVQANAFLGKSINVNNDVPRKWKIKFDTNTLETEYSLSGSIWSAMSQYGWKSQKSIEIQSLTCMDINQSNTGSFSSPQEIIFEGSSQTLVGCPSAGNTNYKILKIEIGRGSFSRSLFINTTTGIIETE